MLTSLKINSALFICSAFIFRLLFVNVGAISSLNTKHTGKPAKSQVTNTLKRRKPCEASGKTENGGRPMLEICESDSDDNDKFKVKPSLLITLFYFFVTNKVSYSIQKIIPSGEFLSDALPQRYLLFQVFRI
jgi:hypothetical protein